MRGRDPERERGRDREKVRRERELSLFLTGVFPTVMRRIEFSLKILNNKIQIRETKK